MRRPSSMLYSKHIIMSVAFKKTILNRIAEKKKQREKEREEALAEQKRIDKEMVSCWS